VLKESMLDSDGVKESMLDSDGVKRINYLIL
jgi:hypothetical protein